MENPSKVAARLPIISKPQPTANGTSSSPTADHLFPDWILSPNSNVHVAVNRAWFRSYTPFQTHIVSNLVKADGPMEVLDIGTIKLQPLIHKSDTGEKRRGCIILQDVMHAPGVLCNVLSRPFSIGTNGDLS